MDVCVCVCEGTLEQAVEECILADEMRMPVNDSDNGDVVL